MTIQVSIKPGNVPEECDVVASGTMDEWLDDNGAVDWGLTFQKMQGLGHALTAHYEEQIVPVGQGYGQDWLLSDHSYWTAEDGRLGNGKRVPAPTVHVAPGKSRIGKLDTNPVIIFKEIGDNRDGDVPLNFKPHIDESISETMESNWSSSKSLGVSTTIGVEVGSEAAGVKAKVESQISMEATWGQGGSKSKTIDVGDGVELEYDIPPGELVVAALTAYRGVLSVETDITGALTGWVWLGFWHKDHHHFFGGDPNIHADIAGMMRAYSDLKTTRQNTMVTTFNFFADGVAAIHPLKSTDPEDVENAIWGSKTHLVDPQAIRGLRIIGIRHLYSNVDGRLRIG